MSESEYATFEDLTSGVAVEEDVELGGGRKVRVRGLSRYEYMLATKMSRDGEDLDLPLFEALITHFGVISPKLSRAQVEGWQKSPGAFLDFQAVHTRIMELSGLREGAEKSQV